MTRLRNLQLRFQDYLLGSSEDIERDIVSTENARAEHRLGAYYNAYRIRLIDCLAIDYLALEKILGRTAFEELALDYLDHYPSTQPSVRWFGRHLPEYLHRVYGGQDREFLADLANWEWALTTVFDAADSETLLALDDMARVAPEDWPRLRFEFKPALRWLDLSWNAPPIRQACDAHREIPPQQRNQHPLRWLLWRRELKTHWRSLDVDEAWAFEQAANGADFAAICEGLLEWIDAEQVSLRAAGLLKQWVGDGLLLRVGKD
ncbi:MAG TPA: DNA-binding domain-containing protein [Gammaproteobacteria bacterium]|jgi:hypothetical protein